MSQTPAAGETDAIKAVIHIEFKRSLVLRPRLSLQPQTQALYGKLAVQVQKSIILASRRILSQSFLNDATPKR